MKLRAAMVAVLCWPALGQADLMLLGDSTSSALGMPLGSQEQIWIHQTQIRRDYSDRGRSITQLFDLTRKQALVIDHASRTAIAYDLGQIGAQEQTVAADVTMDFRPVDGGQTRTLQNWICREYEVSASVPARLGNEETIFHLNGHVWMTGKVPERKAIQELIETTKRPDFFLAVPALAQSAPAFSSVLNALIRKLAPRGLPCSGDLLGSYEGNGPLASLARKLPSQAGMNFREYSSAPIPADKFQLPGGYVIVQNPAAAGMPTMPYAPR